ncbi:hypothetical protein, partial [Streptomyces sp. NPDC001226]
RELSCRHSVTTARIAPRFGLRNSLREFVKSAAKGAAVYDLTRRQNAFPLCLSILSKFSEFHKNLSQLHAQLEYDHRSIRQFVSW